MGNYLKRSYNMDSLNIFTSHVYNVDLPYNHYSFLILAINQIFKEAVKIGSNIVQTLLVLFDSVNCNFFLFHF